MPRVSVIIPTHHRRQLLFVTLESVFAQSYRDFEVIVVDDGSSDGTADALLPLVGEGRLRHVRQDNRGTAVARSRGLAEAQGEFVAFLDDDVPVAAG